MKRLLTTIMAGLLVFTMFTPPVFARDDLKNTDPDKYYILLDLNNQIVTVYEKDDAGEYTRIVRRMVCSSGKNTADPSDPLSVPTPTPRGVWMVGARERFGKFAAFANEYARYWTQIVDGIYFHSIMFSRRDAATLKSGPYRSLGNNVSHGCVRLYVEDAKWLYYYACPGTKVEVSTSEPKDAALVRKLKSSVPFNEYKAMQALFYDEAEQPNRTAWIVKENADMRTGNGSNDKRIRVLDVGEAVEVLQEGEPWCKVRFEEREGYVKTAYLTYEEGVMQSKEDADIVRSTAYLYKEADSGSTRICKIPKSTTVQVLEDVNERFYRVRVWGEEGFMMKNSLIKGWGIVGE